MKRIFLVERVASVKRNPALALALLWARWTGASVWYADGDLQAIRFWRQRFPENAFEEIKGVAAIKKRTHWALYRRAEARKDEIEKSGAFRALQRLYPSPDWSVIIRKAVIIDGFNFVVLGLEASRQRVAGNRVYWLPTIFRPGLVRKAVYQQNVPLLWRFMIQVGPVVLGWLVPIKILFEIRKSLLRQGLVAGPTAPKNWAIGQITDGKMTTVGRIYDEILYDGGVLSPDKILFIINNAPSPEYVKHASESGTTWVYSRDLPCPESFYRQRFIREYLRFALVCSLEAIRISTSFDVFLNILKASRNLLEAQLLALYHRIRVCLGWDSYWIGADIRSMVMKEWDGLNVGWIHAAPWLPLYLYQNTVMPVLLCYGQSVREMFGETLQHVGKIMPVGIFPAETALRPSEELNELRAEHGQSVIVSAFDSSFSPFWGLTREVNELFYEGLLELVETRPKIFLCFKRKYQDEANPDEGNPVYRRYAARFEKHPRIRVNWHDNPYQLIAVSDVVIGITSSTVGWDALSCRKPALFFDPRRQFRDNPAWKYGLVCRTKEELQQGYDAIQNNNYLSQEKWDMIVKRESAYVDTRPLQTLKDFLVRTADLAAPAKLQEEVLR